jgi:RHS repeat-associated protein
LWTVHVSRMTALQSHQPKGSLLGMTDDAGTVAGTRTYSPWGESRSSTGETSSLGFQGDPLDADTGDLGTRLYDPSLGRFTTRDVLFGDPMAP